MVTPDHRFDATPEGQDQLYFEQNHRVLPLSLFFERAYTPHLLAKRVRGEALPSPDLPLLPEPPVIQLSVADFGTRGLVVEEAEDWEITVSHERVRLRYEAHGGTSLLDEVQIFHNGKALELGTRGLVIENDVPVFSPELTREIEVQLVPGTNHFEAVAINALRVESTGSSLHLNYEAPSGREGLDVDLYLLVIAVNQYQNPQYNLNYAVNDARSFRDAVVAGSADLFARVHTQFILDADVSKASILQAFREIAHQARPQDAIIFYYAGHGVMSQEDAPEFFLVPPDGQPTLRQQRAPAGTCSLGRRTALARPPDSCPKAALCP